MTLCKEKVKYRYSTNKGRPCQMRAMINGYCTTHFKMNYKKQLENEIEDDTTNKVFIQ